MLRRPELDLLFGDGRRGGTEARQLRMERAARLVAQASERRANFLAEGSARLATLLDATTTVETIAELAVDGFADYCIVDLTRPDGSIERAAARHADKRKQTLMQRVLAEPPAQNGRSAAARVIHSDAAEIETPRVNGFVSTQVAAEFIDQLAPRLHVIVPLRGRESRLGALTLGFGGGDAWGLNAVDSAQAFARHAGLALERAYQFDETVASRASWSCSWAAISMSRASRALAHHSRCGCRWRRRPLSVGLARSPSRPLIRRHRSLRGLQPTTRRAG